MNVKVKRLHPDAIIPKYAKPGDAGLDLVATDNGNPTQKDGSTYIEYGTGLAVEIPEGHVGLIFPRSSISNTGLALSNAVGVIDSGYRGELKFRFRLDPLSADKSGVVKGYKKGEKIGQMIIVPYPAIELIEAESLSSTDRCEGGYGSTGK